MIFDQSSHISPATSTIDTTVRSPLSSNVEIDNFMLCIDAVLFFFSSVPECKSVPYASLSQAFSDERS